MTADVIDALLPSHPLTAFTGFALGGLRQRPLASYSAGAVRRVLNDPRGRRGRDPNDVAILETRAQQVASRGGGGLRTPVYTSLVNGSISPAEMDEIDAAIAAGTAVYARPLRGRELFDARASEVLRTARVPQPQLASIKPPAIQPRVDIVSTPGPVQPHSPVAGQGIDSEAPMNLSNILGGLTKIAGTAASLAGTYYQIRALRSGAPQAAAVAPAPVPAVTPAPPPPPLSATPAQAIARAQTIPYTAATAATFQPAALPAVLPAITGGAMSLLGQAGKIAGIAAALGIGEEIVQSVLTLDKRTRRRRRRRLLTSSDVKDITVMASLLGKNSEAFKTWLATSQRSR